MWFCSQEPWIIRASGSLPHRWTHAAAIFQQRNLAFRLPSASKPFINSSCSSGLVVGVWGPQTVAFYRLCFNCSINIWVRCRTGEPHARLSVCRLTMMERRRRMCEKGSAHLRGGAFSVFLMNVIGLYLIYKHIFNADLLLYLSRDTITDKGKDNYIRALK